MNIPAGAVEALVRALAVSVLLAWLAPGVQRALAGRRWLWVPLLLPLVTPSIVVGYAYVGAPPGLTTELLYAGLLAASLLPVAVVVQVLLPPPPMAPAARHCQRLAGSRGGDLLHGPLRNGLVVGGLTFVLAFQEFDLASLFSARSWTRWLFDAQTEGLSLGATLRGAAVPAMIEVVVLLAVGTLFARTERSERVAPEEATGGSGFVWPLAAVMAVVVLPGCRLVPGLADIGGQLHLFTEVRNSVVLAAGAVLATGIVTLSCPLPVLAVLSVPGLTGGLVVGLVVQAVFQLPGLSVLYDTPIPVLMGWTLLLLPVAIVLRLALARVTPAASLHLVGLLVRSAGARQQRCGRRLCFAMRGAMLGLAAALLFAMAFFEVVAGDLLAPSNMTPAAPRLYNLLHYGRSAGLSAMVLLMAGSAFGCGVVGYEIWRFVHSRRSGDSDQTTWLLQFRQWVRETLKIPG